MDTSFNALVVAEERETQGGLRKALAHLGCFAECVESMDAAMGKLAGGAMYNLVFASLCLRDSGARKLSRWLMMNRPESSFVLVTGWQGGLDGEFLGREGISGVVHKPLIFNEIRDTVLEHLG